MKSTIGFLVALLFFGWGVSVYADEISKVAAIAPSDPGISEVSYDLGDDKISVDLAFTVVGAPTDTSDITYTLDLYAVGEKGERVLVSRIGTSDVFPLRGGSSAERKVEYTLPKDRAGTYELMIVLHTMSGTIFDSEKVGTFSLSPTVHSPLVLHPLTCTLTVGGAHSGAVSPQDTVKLEKGDTLTSTCSVEYASDGGVEFTPTIHTFSVQNTTREALMTYPSLPSVQMGGSEFKDVAVPIPLGTDPGTYTAFVSYGNEGNTVGYTYVIEEKLQEETFVSDIIDTTKNMFTPGMLMGIVGLLIFMLVALMLLLRMTKKKTEGNSSTSIPPISLLLIGVITFWAGAIHPVYAGSASVDVSNMYAGEISHYVSGSVSTDKGTYAPGEFITITASLTLNYDAGAGSHYSNYNLGYKVDGGGTVQFDTPLISGGSPAFAPVFNALAPRPISGTLVVQVPLGMSSGSHYLSLRSNLETMLTSGGAPYANDVETISVPFNVSAGAAPTASANISPAGPVVAGTPITYSFSSTGAGSCEAKVDGNVVISRSANKTSDSVGPTTGTWPPGVTLEVQCWSGPNGAGTVSTPSTRSITVNWGSVTAAPEGACSAGSIRVSWPALSGATSYEVSKDGGSWTSVGNVTTWLDSGNAQGSAHSYVVRARNAGATSGPSPAAGAMALTCPPPTGTCGTADLSGPLTSPPSSGLCSGVSPTWTDNVGDDGAYNWTCGSASCSATKRVDAQCSSYHLGTYDSSYNSSLCSKGNWGSPDGWISGDTFDGNGIMSTAPSRNYYSMGTYAVCRGLNGGTNKGCRHYFNAICGSANGGTYASQPQDPTSPVVVKQTICWHGTPSWTDTTGSDGTFNWSCSNGSGPTVSCSANKTMTNTRPWGDAGPDRSITLPTSSFTHPGASIGDAEDSVGALTKSWSQIGTSPSVASISNGNTLTPTFSNLTTAGTYRFVLTVRDTGGLTNDTTDYFSSSDAVFTITVGGGSGGCPGCAGGGGPGSNLVDIDAADCTIPAGASSCNTTVTWDWVTGMVSNPGIYQDAVPFATGVGINAKSKVATLGISTVTFQFRQDGWDILETVYAKGICASGSSWDGSKCAVAATSCPAGTYRSWSVGGNTCDGTFPGGASVGGSGTITDGSGTTGNANFTCMAGGTWAALPNVGATCAAGGGSSCPSQRLNWTDPGTGAACSGIIAGPWPDGVGNSVFADTPAGFNGRAGYDCMSGAWVFNPGYPRWCIPAPPPPPKVISLSNSGPIVSGSQATLSYTVNGWDECRITRIPSGTSLGGTFFGDLGSGSRSSDTLMADQTYRLRCWVGSEGSPSVSDTRDTTVVVGGAPNLTAFNGAPPSGSWYASAAPIDFLGSVQNTGGIDVVEAGWADLEIDYYSDGSVDTNLNAYSGTRVGSLTVGQSKTIGRTTSIVPTGSHRYRFRVDTDNTGVPSETTEADNVSPWVPITIGITPDCPAGQTRTWTVAGKMCEGTTPAGGEGTTAAIADTFDPEVGVAVFKCEFSAAMGGPVWKSTPEADPAPDCISVGSGAPYVVGTKWCSILTDQNSCIGYFTWRNATAANSVKLTYNNGIGALYEGTNIVSTSRDQTTPKALSIYGTDSGGSAVVWNDIGGGIASPSYFTEGRCQPGATWDGTKCTVGSGANLAGGTPVVTSTGPYCEGKLVTGYADVRNTTATSIATLFGDAYYYQWNSTSSAGWTHWGGVVYNHAGLGAFATARDSDSSLIPVGGPGTLYVRHCADILSAVPDPTADDCSAPISITSIPGVWDGSSCVPSGPVVTSFTATPNPVAANNDYVLNVSATGASSCLIEKQQVGSSAWHTLAGGSGCYTLSSGSWSSTGQGYTMRATQEASLPGGGINLGVGTNKYRATCYAGPGACVGAASTPSTFDFVINAGGPTAPDLISAGLSIATGPYTVGGNIALGGRVRNIGLTTFPLRFNNNFTYRWGTTGAWLSFPGNVDRIPPLNTGEDAVDDAVFVPAVAGTNLYFQHCVDSDNEINEGANETPNCEEIGPFTVNSSGPAPTITRFEICDNDGVSNCALTRTVATGTPLKVVWNANDATRCDMSRGADFTTSGNTSGTDSITASAIPVTTTDYQMICSGPGGITSSPVASVTTHGIRPILSASRTVVKRGETITLSWDTNNGNETLCGITGGGLTGYNPLPAGGDVERGTTGDIVINGRTTFRLTCGALSDVKTIDIIGDGGET